MALEGTNGKYTTVYKRKARFRGSFEDSCRIVLRCKTIHQTRFDEGFGVRLKMEAKGELKTPASSLSTANILMFIR